MGFGVILGKDGKKLKTRSGITVKLSDLLDEGKERAMLRLKERLDNDNNATTHLSEEELNYASEIMAISCIKYFDLKQNYTTAYRFD
jgi:arginyl-tRNA synthetase